MIRLSACLLCVLLAMPTAAKERFQQPGPVHLDKKGEKWARESLKKMSLEQKIGQMFMIWAFARFINVTEPEYIGLRDTMRKYHIGGFALTVSFEDGLLYKNAAPGSGDADQSAAAGFGVPAASSPPTSSAALGYRLNGVTSFPHAMAFGATGDVDYARESGRITAQEARAIGVQWNWFPDADVNSNPLNPIINTRSFGEDPKQVSDMVAAYIERRARVRHDDHGQTFSRSRRYRQRFPPGGSRDQGRSRASGQHRAAAVPRRHRGRS